MARASETEIADLKGRALDLLRSGECTTEAQVARALGRSTRTIRRWLEDDASFAAAWRAALARDPLPEEGFPSFLDFRRQYFKRESFWFHRDAHERLETEDRLVMLVPPNHAKTTVWSIEYSTYLIFRSAALDPARSLRVLIVQKSEDQARKVVGAVQTRLTSHEFYERLGIPREENPITRYGGPLGFKPRKEEMKPWATDHFTVASAISGEKDYTLEAKGVQGSIVGQRVDLAIIDDPQDPKTVSPSAIDEMVRWTNQAVLSRVPQRLVLLGSRIGPTDYWSRVLEEEWSEDWPVIRYAAILPCNRHGTEPFYEDCEHMERRLLCPDLWAWGPDERRVKLPDGRLNLRKARKEAGRFWWPTWMQAEGVAEDATFSKESMQRCRDDDRVLGRTPPEVTHIVLGVDPATEGYCAMVLWGIDQRTKQRYLIDLFNEKGLRTIPRVVDRMIGFVTDYRVNALVVEQNNTQRTFSTDDRLRREVVGRGTMIETYQTVTESGARREGDDFNRSSVAALFDEGLVTLPYGDERTRAVIDAYIAQCVSYRPGIKWQTKDMVDATLFAESKARIWARLQPRHRKPPNRAPDWARETYKRWETEEQRRRKLEWRTLSQDEVDALRGAVGRAP